MATRRMIANRAMRYGGKVLSAGDEFKASRQDARVLEALGRAAGAPEPTAPQPSAPEPTAPESSATFTASTNPMPAYQYQRSSSGGFTAGTPDSDDAKSEETSTRARALTKVQLAAEFEAATGGKPDGRWNKNRLEQELEAVRGTYRRRDMRADT